MHHIETAASSSLSHFLVDGTDAVASLRRRISAVRTLREHHIWEAVRVMPSLSGFREDSAAFAKFRALMDHDALDEAIMLLAASTVPKSELIEVTKICGIWSCKFARDKGKTCRRVFTSHPLDRSAALLAALVTTDSKDA